MDSISSAAKYLTENAQSLAIEIVDDIIHRFEFEVPKEEIEQAIIAYTNFWGFLGESVTFAEENKDCQLNFNVNFL
ncbi:hypothetical protein ACFOU2_11800 [Bacillus songklensis]|uniref:Uncharacterized protein n=1 Tax=Bacillus songklensis TaxID=1069116 RepID=A0ABV8B394_9BACI